MKYRPLLIVAILLASAFSGCSLDDEALKLKFEGYAPEPLNDGWEISTPEAEGFDRGKIDNVYETFFSEKLYPTLHSLLIVRNGKLVAEAYCRDKNDIDNYHPLQSATKSITSILMGIAIDKGLIDSVYTPIYHFIPEYFDNDTRKQAITIHHALTMTTGLQFDNDSLDVSEMMYYPGNSLEFVLHRNLEFYPGTDFHYHDGNPQLISGVIQKVSGMTLEEFAVENLFHPLGINHYQWEKCADGRTLGAAGLWLRPRDMAKIGKLMIQNGMWNGKQIVSAEWVAQSTKIYARGDEIYARGDYGYYWWIWQSRNAFQASGHGGQYIYIIPDRNLVIIMTADTYIRYDDSGKIILGFYSPVFDDIANAIIE